MAINKIVRVMLILLHLRHDFFFLLEGGAARQLDHSSFAVPIYDSLSDRALPALLLLFLLILYPPWQKVKPEITD